MHVIATLAGLLLQVHTPGLDQVLRKMEAGEPPPRVSKELGTAAVGRITPHMTDVAQLERLAFLAREGQAGEALGRSLQLILVARGAASPTAVVLLDELPAAARPKAWPARTQLQPVIDLAEGEDER